MASGGISQTQYVLRCEDQITQTTKPYSRGSEVCTARDVVVRLNRETADFTHEVAATALKARDAAPKQSVENQATTLLTERFLATLLVSIDKVRNSDGTVVVEIKVTLGYARIPGGLACDADAFCRDIE